MILSIVILPCISNVRSDAVSDVDDADWYTTENVAVRLVQALFRHGDRSPTRSYVNDIYKESYWPQGFGQLSTTGMQQEMKLGQYIRNVYINRLQFICDAYRRTELHVRSSSLDRALMSASSVLAGIYPPSTTDWNSTMGWQPIPVHTVPQPEDYLLLGNTPCPVAEDITTHTLETSPKIQQIMENYKDFYEYVSNNSGEPNSWTGIGQVLDPLFVQYVSKNTKLPDWVTDDILKQLLELHDLYTELWFPDGTEFLRGGPLLKEMIEHMVNKSTDVLSQSVPQKLFLYSAHDSTIVMLLRAMGLFNNRKPPYTACVILELLENPDHEFFVRVLYKNDTLSSPTILTLEGCNHKEKCPLETFVNLYKYSLPINLKQECGVTDSNASSSEFSKGSEILDVALICGILFALVFLVVYMYRTRDKSRDSQEYMPVPTELSDLT